MMFFETPIFTKRIQHLVSDDDYRQLQLLLIKFPELGKLIKGSGGVRKLRWSSSGTGKRGGIRVLYYFINQLDQIYMLFAFSKSEVSDLSHEQLRLLKKVVSEELQ
jgi:mRNA-degrading endonuclease RelE of RelBE toxin-antitoxin system